MTRPSSRQRAIVERVMHEFREGVLETGQGTPVRGRRQAVAIALHEAGASNQEDPATNRRNLARTMRRERTASEAAARSDLYAEAKRRNIPGRSRMRKAELARALQR